MIKMENELRSGKWIQTNPTWRRLEENYAGKGIGRGDDEEGVSGRTVLQQRHRVVTWCLKAIYLLHACQLDASRVYTELRIS